jgi:hypothetical protein
VKLNRCPICHHHISLAALVQDEAARELVGIVTGLDTDAGTALVMYLGLFRSANRDLAHDRALRLAREVLALGPVNVVAAAMRKTVDSLQGRLESPLANHNYMQKILNSELGLLPAMQPNAMPVPTAKIAPASKTSQGIDALQEWMDGT